MISCKHASKLISKAADEPLSRIEKLQLKLHLYVCEFCIQFQRNIQIVRDALRRLADDEADPKEIDEPSASVAEKSKPLKERLKKSVQDKLKEK